MHKLEEDTIVIHILQSNNLVYFNNNKYDNNNINKLLSLIVFNNECYYFLFKNSLFDNNFIALTNKLLKKNICLIRLNGSNIVKEYILHKFKSDIFILFTDCCYRLLVTKEQLFVYGIIKEIINDILFKVEIFAKETDLKHKINKRKVSDFEELMNEDLSINSLGLSNTTYNLTGTLKFYNQEKSKLTRIRIYNK